jgi:hypothetical protein
LAWRSFGVFRPQGTAEFNQGVGIERHAVDNQASVWGLIVPPRMTTVTKCRRPAVLVKAATQQVINAIPDRAVLGRRDWPVQEQYDPAPAGRLGRISYRKSV